MQRGEPRGSFGKEAFPIWSDGHRPLAYLAQQDGGMGGQHVSHAAGFGASEIHYYEPVLIKEVRVGRSS